MACYRNVLILHSLYRIIKTTFSKGFSFYYMKWKRVVTSIVIAKKRNNLPYLGFILWMMSWETWLYLNAMKGLNNSWTTIKFFNKTCRLRTTWKVKIITWCFQNIEWWYLMKISHVDIRNKDIRNISPPM